ncbi:hypothetical protein Tco_1281226 [Tanacetum coccineum]
MVAYLLKPEGSEDFHQIVDFLYTSHIKFALTENPTIYTSLIQRFWQTASTSTLEDGEVEITATIDGQFKTITEASLRRHLKLEDADGISSLPNTEIFEKLALMGPKKTAWEQFSSNIATAIICLTTNRIFNFSKMLFEGMRLLLPHKRTYVVPTLTQKLFSNLRWVSKGYTGVNIPLFLSMLVQGPIQVPTPPHDSPFPGGHIPGSDEGSMTLNELTVLCTQLSTKVASLEQDLKQTKKKKTKKQLEQERLGHEEAIRLQEQINEEERQRIARDAEIAKQLQEEFDRARQEQEVVAEVDQAYDIDWSDPAVLRLSCIQNRSFFVTEVRKNMCMYLKNQEGYKQSHFNGMSYEDIRPIFEDKKRSREDSDEDNAKKQKLEDDAEKEELRDSMDVVLRDDIAIDVESLATKYPIVDWKTHVLTENMMYYQIIRADGSSKNYKVF